MLSQSKYFKKWSNIHVRSLQFHTFTSKSPSTWLRASIYHGFYLRRLSLQHSIGWAALSSLVRSFVRSFVRSVGRPVSVTSPLMSTIWCCRPYNPNIFCKNMILAMCHIIILSYDDPHIIIKHKTHDICYIFGKKRTQGYQIWHLHIISASSVHHQCIINASAVHQ